MRLKERTLITVKHAPRITVSGELGGMAEGFSDQTVSLRASLLPEGGELAAAEKGVHTRARLKLLLPGDASAQAGDGVWVDGALWRILAVRRWAAHAEWICEALV